MLEEINIKTSNQTELINITENVQKIINNSKVKNGTCFVFAAHTTAGLTINENDDPNVKKDILEKLEELIPKNKKYKHCCDRNNAPAHIKSTLAGNSVMLFIKENKLITGTWQAIFFCEFDGPRERKVYIKIIPD